MNKISLPILLLVLVISACTKKKTEDPSVYQKYKVVYQIKENTTYATATFRNSGEWGTNVVFEDNSEITANGSKGVKQLMCDEGYCYSYYSWNIDSLSDVTFILRKKNNVPVNTVSRADMGTLNIVIDSVLSVKEIMRMSWSGTPLRDSETVSMSMKRNYDGAGATCSTSGDFKTSEIALDYKQTQQFIPGTYTVSLFKYKSVNLQHSDGQASGSISVALIAEKQVVVK